MGMLFKKITLLWLAMVGVALLSLLLPHEEVTISSLLNNSLQMLLFIICVFIVKKEPTRRSKYIFLNFAVFFGCSVLFHVYNFIPSQTSYARLFFFQYIGSGAYYFALTLAIAYLTIDFLFCDLKTIHKYGITVAIVGAFFLYYFHPIILDPLYIYSTPEASDFIVLEKEYKGHQNEFGNPPTAEELALKVTLPRWEGNAKAGFLGHQDILSRVTELYPYLVGEHNYVVLFVKPLYLNIISMCIVCLGFIILFFGYQYVKDPPQGAYVEKIVFLFLIFSTMEVLHAWSYVKSIEWEAFYEIMNLGQVISLGILLLIGIFFILRLKFITSAKGEYYEQEIATSPAGITRWRDALDELIIHQFFEKGRISGRFFVDRHHSS